MARNAGENAIEEMRKWCLRSFCILLILSVFDFTAWYWLIVPVVLWCVALIIGWFVPMEDQDG